MACGVDEPLADIYVTILRRERKNTVAVTAPGTCPEDSAMGKDPGEGGVYGSGNVEVLQMVKR